MQWRDQALHEAVIHYVHRGAPGNTKVVPGSDVVELGRSFMGLRDRHGVAMIPYHRVFRIERGDECVWERRGHEAEGGAGEGP